MGLVGSLAKYTFLTVAGLLAFIAFLVYLPLIEVHPVSYSLPRPPEFVGELADNDVLSKAEQLFHDQIQGPESLNYHQGALYTGLSNGDIIEIKDGHFRTVANIGGDCRAEGLWDQPRCGRPLTLRFDKAGHCFAIDAHHGIKQIDIKTGKVKTLLDITKTPIGGRRSKFFDDMALDDGAGQNGGHVFYISDASSKWTSDEHVIITGEFESTGRIVRFDSGSGQATVAVDGIGFPNGVELTDDRQAIIYSELNSRRLMIHYIRGAKKGHTEIFSDNLPGEETYWVALFNGRNGSHPHWFLDELQDKPLTRKAIARVVYNVGVGLFWVGDVLNYHPLKDLGYALKSGFLFAKTVVGRGLVLEIDRTGRIVRALHSPDKRITALSEVREVIEGDKKVLYLGSYYNSYLGRLELPQ